MINEPIDISSKPIKLFLDTVDQVLNSNTFLLPFEVKADNIDEALLGFIASESFIHQLASQDKEREWFNLHYFDHKTGNYKLKNGNILKSEIDLKIKEIVVDKSDYLIAMLTGDTSKGRFFSYYSKEISLEKAKVIVDNLISFLTTYDKYSEWKLFFVEPDFLKDTVERYSKNEELTYFNGGFGNDTATVILTNNKGFLLLTNGID